MRIRGALINYCPFFEGEHLEHAQTSWATPIFPQRQAQAHVFPHGWLKYLVHPYIPTMIGWIIGGRVHHKSCARMFTHPS